MSATELKRLPEDRQEAIVELLAGPEMSLRQAAEELQKDGLVTSTRALSEFRSWWGLSRQYRESATDTETLIDLLRRQRPELTPEELARYGNEVFQLQALKTQDVDTFLSLHKARMEETKLELSRQKLELDERRVAILERKAALADEAQTVLGETKLSPEQQMQRIKEIFGQS